MEDFGIYNIAGGIITMFSFLNSAMSSSTQRYITFELGKEDHRQLHKVFRTSVNIHLLIALFYLDFRRNSRSLVFFYEKMIIPPARMYAAFLGLSVFCY